MLIFPLGGLKSSRSAAEVIIRGGTDNSANEALSAKRTSTKMPLMLILMQLAQASYKLGVRLALTWRPRGENAPADDLTNEDFSKFTLTNRIHVSWNSLDFSLLSMLLALKNEFELDLLTAKRLAPLAWVPMSKKRRVATRTPW